MQLSTLQRLPSFTAAVLCLAMAFCFPCILYADEYLLTGFTAETGDDLGLGGYADSTATSGKQCKATFLVAAGTKSITKTFIKGESSSTIVSWGKSKKGVIHSPHKDGSASSSTTPSASSPLWQIATNNHNGYRNQDGTWTVILSFPKGNAASLPKACRLIYNGKVKVEFEWS